jgi:hypothetical protein
MTPDPAGIRVFSLEEVNALVPRLRDMVGQQIDIGQEIQRRVAELYALIGSEESAVGAEVVDITVYPEDSEAARRLKRELSVLIGRYKQGWRDVQELGAVVKDTNTGLLDFYGRVDDRLVWLCWKYGEESIDFYHELDAGFSGRKPLAPVRKHLLN